MNAHTKSVLRGIVACALVPSVIAGVISPILGISVFIASFLLASLVGYPVYLLLKRYRFVTNGWVASIVGLLVGLGLAAYVFFPSTVPGRTSSRGTADNLVYTVIDGVPTQVAWNDFYLACGLMALVGAMAGLCFWLFGTSATDDPNRPNALGMQPPNVDEERREL
jgi:hypothetical protein